MTNRTDNFNRTNTTTNIGTPSDGGSAWTQYSGTWGILSNNAYKSAAGGTDVCALESSISDADVQVTLVVRFQLSCGVAARLADNNNYLLGAYPSSGALPTMYKVVAGVFTTIGTGTVSAADGDVMKFSLSGSSLNLYINGVLKIGPITDSTGLTNTQHGLWDASNANIRWDDFSITGSGGGATFNPGWASGATRTIGMGVY